MSNLSLTLFALAMVLAGPLLTLAALPSASHGLVLVLSPPWTDREAPIARAGGHGLGTRISSLGTLAQADNAEFATRLRATGPFLVLDGRAIAALCGVTG